jgi:hypothetical protein
LTSLAILVNNRDELGFGKIIMSNVITTVTELGFEVHNQVHGFNRRHKSGELLEIIMIARILGGC